jgi:GT2 family glycosyltransferase
LVDNASTECDPQTFKDAYPDLKLIRSEVNLGFAKGNNLGIKQAAGEYILLLNSDTELIEDSVSKSIAYADQLKDLGALSCKLIHPDGRHQSVAQRFPSVRYLLFERLRINKLLSKKKVGRILLGAFFKHDENLEVDWVWGAFFLFKRDSLKLLENGQLNDEYFMYFEDMQWCLDFKRNGLKNYYFAETSVIHKMGGSNARKFQLLSENKTRYLNKNYNSLSAWLLNILYK